MISKELVSANTRRGYLIITAFAITIAFYGWQGLLNNFSVEIVQFDGQQIGNLHSIREIPGFLAFTALFWFLLFREQYFGLFSLALMGIGITATGYFPSELGLYLTTFIMSIGFHYYETVNQSLTLQWIDKDTAPVFMGRIKSVQGGASIGAYGIILLCTTLLTLSYKTTFFILGSIPLLCVAYLALKAPAFEHDHPQHRKIILKKNYWLYYALTFLGGARRQIFVVFAGFLLVTKFGFSISEITALYLVNHLIVMSIAPSIGRLIQRFGERKALVIEYIGLIAIFAGYGMTESPYGAAGLYMLDHVFFALHFAIHTYFQKIADRQDIAATAAVSFTINHIAAVILPVILGAIWLVNPAAVFYTGAIFAGLSLLLALVIPRHPTPSNISILSRVIET